MFLLKRCLPPKDLKAQNRRWRQVGEVPNLWSWSKLQVGLGDWAFCVAMLKSASLKKALYLTSF